MPEVAHRPDCICPPCRETRPDGYKQPAPHDWQADAREAGELHRTAVRDIWQTAFLVARNVEPSIGGRPKKTSNGSEVSGRVSFNAFAKTAGIGMSDKTVARYYAAWQEAARQGLVPPADHLTPTRKVKAIDNLTVEQWDAVKPKAIKAAPSGQTSNRKASGARKSIPAATATDRTVPADPNGRSGKATSDEYALTGSTTRTVDGVVLPIGVGDAPMLTKVHDTTKAIKAVMSALRAGYPIEGATTEAMVEMFNAMGECRNLAMAMIKAKG